ncbi:DUF2752 domain-containing protein [bacterium]|nr:DUF2752 domain-containing protein [bacterium]
MDCCPQPTNASQRRDRLVILAAVAVAAMAVLAVSTVARSAGVSLCVFHELTGWYCPGCGATRAAIQLAHGHWAEAFRMNPALVCLLPLAAYGLIRAGRPEHRAPLRIRPAWIGVLVAVILIFAVVRNIPALPWAGLAP